MQSFKRAQTSLISDRNTAFRSTLTTTQETNSNESPELRRKITSNLSQNEITFDYSDSSNSQIIVNKSMLSENSNNCNICNKKFSVLLKKKQCFFCFKFVCHKHAKRKRADPQNKTMIKRICDHCHVRYLCEIIFSGFEEQKQEKQQKIDLLQYHLGNYQKELIELKSSYHSKNQDIKDLSTKRQKENALVKDQIKVVKKDIKKQLEIQKATVEKNDVLQKQLASAIQNVNQQRVEIQQNEGKLFEMKFQLKGIVDDIVVLQQKREKQIQLRELKRKEKQLERELTIKEEKIQELQKKEQEKIEQEKKKQENQLQLQNLVQPEKSIKQDSNSQNFQNNDDQLNLIEISLKKYNSQNQKSFQNNLQNDDLYINSMTLGKPNKSVRSISNLNDEQSTNSNNSTGGKPSRGGQTEMYDNYNVDESLLDSIHKKKQHEIERSNQKIREKPNSCQNCTIF